jgi:predicted DsbA family dithiol-disulfide isomerase
MREIRIDCWADVTCPWCLIAEKRLSAAITARPRTRMQLQWQPFRLQPELPREGMRWDRFVEWKFGGWERARTVFDQISRAGAEEGIEFRFDLLTSVPNTLDAHRLILYAATYGLAWSVAVTLMAAYFCEGAELNDVDRLAELAGWAGLDQREAAVFLAGDRLTTEVTRSCQEAERRGIQGVPLFVIAGGSALYGAQPSDRFGEALDRAVRTRTDTVCIG